MRASSAATSSERISCTSSRILLSGISVSVSVATTLGAAGAASWSEVAVVLTAAGIAAPTREASSPTVRNAGAAQCCALA